MDQVMKFSGTPEGAGPVAFVLSSTNGSKYSVIGHQRGFVRLLNIESLKVEGTYKLSLHPEDEVFTAGIYNPNGINVAIGTSLGNIFLGSIREDSQGRPKVMFGKVDVYGVFQGQGVTSLQFSHFDPVGSFLASFDNGLVRTWQSSVRNEQFMKLLEI